MKFKKTSSYNKMVKGAMDFLEPSWSDIAYFYEDFMKVWKPNEKGPIGRFEMRYKVPTLRVPITRRN